MAKAPQVAVRISALDDYSAQFKEFQGYLANVRKQVDAIQGPMKQYNAAQAAQMNSILGTARAGASRIQQTVSGFAGALPGGGMLAGLGTAAGIGAAITSYAQFGTNLHRTSQQAGVTAQGLNSLRGAARMVGLDAGTADQAMVGLNDALQGAAFGKNPQAANYFRLLGIDFGNARDGATRLESVLPKLSDKLKDIYSVNPSAAITLGSMFGLSPDAVALLSRGADEVERMRRAAAALSPVTKESQESAEQYAKSVGQISTAAEGLRNVLVTKLTPAFVPMITGFTEWVQKQSETEAGVKRLTLAAEGLAGTALFRVLFGGAATAGILRWGLPALGLGLTGPAGGEDAEFSARKNAEYLRNHPRDDGPGFFSRLWSRFTGSGEANPAAGLPVDKQKAAGESFAFWRSKGFTPAGAASMAAQEIGESGGNPAARGDSNEAHGLYQHHADRRARILANTGINISTETDPNRQREATYQEMRQRLDEGAGRAYDRIRTTNDLQTGVEAGVNDFERPADRAGDIAKRMRTARDILRMYGKEPADADATSAGQPSQSKPESVSPAPAININRSPAQPSTAPATQSTVRIDLNHNSPPEGTTLSAEVQGAGAAMGVIRTRRSMPQQDWSRGY